MVRLNGIRERRYFEYEASPVKGATRLYGLSDSRDTHHVATMLPRPLAVAGALNNGWHDHTHVIKALRLDAIIEGDADAVGKGFAKLLAGLRANIIVGLKPQYESGLTFVRGALYNHRIVDKALDLDEAETHLSAIQQLAERAANVVNVVTDRSERAHLVQVAIDTHYAAIRRLEDNIADELIEARTPTAPLPDLLPNMQHGVIGPLPVDIIVPARQGMSVDITYDGAPVQVSFLRVVVMGLVVRDIA